ncbi:MAG TPA: hypothetical protein IAD30_02565 [Bacteroidetes bacterium]|nr:hypothetical protein [Bacteroidota bacterium]
MVRFVAFEALHEDAHTKVKKAKGSGKEKTKFSDWSSPRGQAPSLYFGVGRRKEAPPREKRSGILISFVTVFYP